MRKMSVRSIKSADPVFRDAVEAIKWASPRNQVAIHDSESIRGCTVEVGEYSDESAELVLQRRDEYVYLYIQANDSSASWSLERHSRFAAKHRHECDRDIAKELHLQWSTFDSVWNRHVELHELLGKTLVGVRASNQYLWVYPEKCPPLSFSAVVNLTLQLPMLYWEWDEAGGTDQSNSY